MKKTIILIYLLFFASIGFSANYPLDIINIDEAGVNNRIRFAYTGIEYRVIIGAVGGDYPYSWSLTTSPTGMVIDELTGEITWPNPIEAGSPHNVTVKVTGDGGDTDSESFTITVTTSTDRFIFVAPTDDGTPTGSISDPYDSLADFWGTSQENKIVYFRAGTYTLPDVGLDPTHDSKRVTIAASNPIGFLAYPSENVIINCEKDSEAPVNKGYHFYTSQDDLYFQGITFTNGWNYGWGSYDVDQLTMHSVTWKQIETDSDPGHNYAYMFLADAGTSDNFVMKLCNMGDRFGGSELSGVTGYNVNYADISENSFTDCGDKALFLKDDCDNWCIQHNTFNGIGEGVTVYGQGSVDDNEIRFNYFSGDFFKFYPYQTASNIFFYRNTLINNFEIRSISGTDMITEAFNIYDNVIQNDITDYGSPGDGTYREDHIQYYYLSTNELSKIILSGNIISDYDLTTVDVSGKLIGDWAQYVGQKGWETGIHKQLTLGSGTKNLDLTGTPTKQIVFH